MKQIKVTFYKEVTNYDLTKEMREITFFHTCDENKTDWENQCSAYDEACKKGHDPHKHIKFKFINT